MNTASGASLRILEMAVDKIRRDVSRLMDRMGRAEQLAPTVPGGGGGGSGGGGTGAYYADVPSSGSWPATGTLASGSPGTFTADVYRADSGSFTLVTAGATIRNGFPSSPTNGARVAVNRNADGSFSTVGEGC